MQYYHNISCSVFRMRRFSCEKKPPKVKRLSIRGTRQRTTSFRLNLSKNADHIRRLAEKENHSLPSTSETTTQPVGPSSVFEGKPGKRIPVIFMNVIDGWMT